MIRIPSLGEFFALFFLTAKVDSIVHGIEAAARRAEACANINRQRAGMRVAEAVDLEDQAARKRDATMAHDKEAARAQRVTGRLLELVS